MDNELWSNCPDCGAHCLFPVLVFDQGFFMAQTCPACGSVGRNLHFTAEPF